MAGLFLWYNEGMKKLKMLIVGVVAILGLNLVVQPVRAFTCPDGSVRAGDSVGVASQCNVPKDEEGGSVNDVIASIVNFLIGITAVIAVFVIVIAGIQMATSQGEATKVAKARNMILYGLVGLVIAVFAYAIVNFVIVRLFGPSADTYSTAADCQNAGYTWDATANICK